MRRLLNTLYLFTEDACLSLTNQNVVIRAGEDVLGRVPLHTLESIVSFSYRGASPALMGAYAEKGIGLSFFTPRGKYLASVSGEINGNVLLRRTQYRTADNVQKSLEIAKNFIIGKLINCKAVLARGVRDHALRIDVEAVELTLEHLQSSLLEASNCQSIETLRGIEGDAAAVYFRALDQLVLRDRDAFAFKERTRRPPRDRFNCMLSLFYTVLARDCASALLGAGLDPYVGFLHVDRSGRQSLALDLMEELRPAFVDRFVITAINNRIVAADDFMLRETGEVQLLSAAKKRLFKAWQDKKAEVITHLYLKEKMQRGLVPHVQALLLARCIRGDLDGYPPFAIK